MTDTLKSVIIHTLFNNIGVIQMALDREFDFDFDGEIDSNDSDRFVAEVSRREYWDSMGENASDYFSISSVEESGFDIFDGC